MTGLVWAQLCLLQRAPLYLPLAEGYSSETAPTTRQSQTHLILLIKSD